MTNCDDDTGSASTTGRRTIELWRHTVHILTAHLMLDLRERRLRRLPHADEIGEVYAVAIVATDTDMAVLAATVGRSRYEEAAVAALDRALAAIARDHAVPSDEFWKLTSDPVVVVTDEDAPFSSRRFRRAVVELGCEHRLRRADR